MNRTGTVMCNPWCTRQQNWSKEWGAYFSLRRPLIYEYSIFMAVCALSSTCWIDSVTPRLSDQDASMMLDKVISVVIQLLISVWNKKKRLISVFLPQVTDWDLQTSFIPPLSIRIASYWIFKSECKFKLLVFWRSFAHFCLLLWRTPAHIWKHIWRPSHSRSHNWHKTTNTSKTSYTMSLFELYHHASLTTDSQDEINTLNRGKERNTYL